MHFIQGADRQQMQFISLDDSISSDNAVRILDAFVDKVDLAQLGFTSAVHKSEGRPPFEPAVLLKLYLYGYLNRIRSSRRLQTECVRNIELQWLLQQLTPNYHTIANFRRDNAAALKALFKLFVLFLRDQQLISGDLIAVDGSKFRAQNSKKNNYNQKKIDRHIAYIEEKAAAYLQDLDSCDEVEATCSSEITSNKEKVQQELKKLKARKEKYQLLETQLQQNGEDQISTTDPDSRGLLLHRNIVEVSYNVQTAVDAEHNLLVHVEATNSNDRNALHQVALEAKAIVQQACFTVLADKGYHNGRELHQCAQSSIVTIVPCKAHVDGNSNGPQPAYYVAHFSYNEEKDCYTCPAGNVLTTSGAWHNKTREHSPYRFKKYRTADCKTCPVKQLCTGRNSGREIERSEYQSAVDVNNKRVMQQKELYLRRQAIVEHPFGTIKRGWGYTHTLVKGRQKVDGEMNLIALVYDLKRTMNIMGIDKLLNALKTWTPDYRKALYIIKRVFMRHIFSSNQPHRFLHLQMPALKRIA
jgi:transposase